MTAYSNEEWRDIQGFKGLYQISNLGRVRSCDRYLKASYGSRQFKRGQIIKETMMHNGYLIVDLHRNGSSVRRFVHRLVAEAFINNPKCLPEINHIDEDKTNNRADNLEWCTHLYNLNYGHVKDKISKAHIDGNYGSIPIVQLDKDGNIIAHFRNASDAEKVTGISASSIRKVCLQRPRFKSAGGYIWRNE